VNQRNSRTPSIPLLKLRYQFIPHTEEDQEQTCAKIVGESATLIESMWGVLSVLRVASD